MDGCQFLFGLVKEKSQIIVSILEDKIYKLKPFFYVLVLLQINRSVLYMFT